MEEHDSLDQYVTISFRALIINEVPVRTSARLSVRIQAVKAAPDSHRTALTARSPDSRVKSGI